MKDKIALIDFCGTIADFQTFDPYLLYVIEREYPHRSRVLNSWPVRRGCELLTLIMHAFGWRHYLYKLLLVRQLNGLRREKLEEYGKLYYEQRIRNHLISSTLEIISALREQDYRLMIVSGGSELYIQWFAQEYGIDDVLGARFEYNSDICTGKLLIECMGLEKQAILQEYMRSHGIAGELAVGISDSRSDLPMLELCQKKIVISHHEHQQWVSEGMEEIVYK